MHILGKIELWEIRVIGTVAIFQVTQIPPPICDMTKIRVSSDPNLVIGGPHVASIVVTSYDVVCLWMVLLQLLMITKIVFVGLPQDL